MNKGKVYLIGAGPGDPDLLTLKGKRILSLADVIVYDRLINNKILKFAKPNAELIYVGKEKGFHLIKQEQIIKILTKKALENKIVARLKGGDPFVFGRGAEEAEALAESKVDFEVIPGVTSAIAVPAYAGIPVTHRKYCSSLVIATGHEDAVKTTSAIDWKNLALHNGTLIFLMGTTNLKNIANNLISAGKSSETPSAVITWGTYPQQKTVAGKLKNIAELAAKNKITPPGVLVIGEVVNLQKKLCWFEKKPLFGKKILITRAKEDVQKLAEKLEELGAEIISWPIIKRESLKLNLPKLKRCDYIIFTSPATIEFAKNISILKKSKIYAIGPETKKSLEKYNLKVHKVSSEFSTSGLIKEFKKTNLKNKSILILNSAQAPKKLSKSLSKLSAIVKTISVYETIPEKYSNSEIQSKLKQKFDIITFTSSSCVKYFYQLTKKFISPKNLKSKIACLGAVTASTAKQLGYKVWCTAKIYTLEGLTREIVVNILVAEV